MTKLNSSIPSNSVKLIELYNKIVSGSLITGPDFQRKELVWKKQHKYSFIETILLNFPFPEIYIASEELNLDELKSREIVVDGQQRLTTIVDYIHGRNDFSNQKSIKSFDDLNDQEKKDFLNYLITVKDLKDLSLAIIKQIFKRINSTNYSLNSNEILNAEYGGGEFAIFCKILADKNYNPSTTETEISINPDIRHFINSFFERYDVFSDNDVKRMFDSQFIMLICSTILEGQYFGRSTKINDYLVDYNEDFEIYSSILEKIYNALTLIDSLGLSEKSYWFNKANLFTLIIEIIKVNGSNIDKNLLELHLSELENKVDLYFVGDEENLNLITADEMKYFEVARQGSHEQSAREHRGKVIRQILERSLFMDDEVLNDNINLLSRKGINYAILIPTATGLAKGIMDATQNIRNFLFNENIHNYETQLFGPQDKIKRKANFVLRDSQYKEIDVSYYRSNGRGDYRIWFSELKSFADANDELILINQRNNLIVLNKSKFDYSDFINSNF